MEGLESVKVNHRATKEGGLCAELSRSARVSQAGLTRPLAPSACPKCGFVHR